MIAIQTRPALSGAAMMVTAGALFAAVNTLVQWVTMMRGLPAPTVAFWQYVVALAFYLPWLMSRAGGAIRTRHLGLHLLRVACAAGGVQLWVIGLAHVPIWQAIALIMLSPFFVTFGAGLLLAERVPLARWLAVVGGFVGGMIVLAPWSEAFTPAALLPVGAAALWAATSLMTKYMTGMESPESLTVWLLLLLTPVNAVLAAPSGLVPALSVGVWVLGAVVLAGVLTAISQYLLARAYATADAAYLQPFDHLKLPMNVALGLVVFGFAPPGSLWLGSALIIGASLWLIRSETQASEKAG